MSAAKTAISIIINSHNQLSALKLTTLALLDQKPLFSRRSWWPTAAPPTALTSF